MSQETPISIKCEQSLGFAGAEGWQTGRTVFVQLFDSMVSSGLLAKLTGNAFKVLSALGLAASPLGMGSEQDLAFLQDLVAAGIVTAEDRGKLFCCVLHDELVRRTGISKNTLSRCTAELEGHGMVEKREICKPDGTRYKVFFILPASHLDKYNTHRLLSRATKVAAIPKIGTAPGDAIPRTGTARTSEAIPDSGMVPRTGTNLIFPPTTTPTTTAAATGRMVTGFDRDAVLAYFARRKGVGRYHATAHDEKKLALLQESGYSQDEILAAIDLAFDSLPPDAPFIRMFSYCATVVLATLPRRLSTAEGDKNTTIERPGDPASSPPVTASGKPDTPSVLKYAMRLYESEIGLVTPLIEDELRILVDQYPDPDAWDTAFREAVRANVPQLRYVQQVLKGQATRARSTLPLSGGTDVKQQSQSSRSRAGRNGDGRRRRTASPGRSSGSASDAYLEAAQQRAAAMQPLDLVTVLGTADA
jgi:hypothetical protein